jgi:hypothetical protein
MVGQQHNRAGIGERRAFTPERQPVARERVITLAGGCEDETDGTIGKRADAWESRRAIRDLGERRRERLLAGPGNRRDATDVYGRRALQQQDEER